MKSLLAFGILFFALSVCGITEKIKETVGDTSKNADPAAKEAGGETDSAKSDGGGETVEKPNPTMQQQEIIDKGNKVVWEDQGMGFIVPDGWNKVQVSKQIFNYGSPAKGFLIVTISPMGGDFPTETSLKAFYDELVRKKNDGEVDLARYMEIDDVKGIESVEAMPESKSDPRRYQWMGYRNYNNQVQLVNIILSTDADKFNDKSETFGAVLYSMKFNN